MEKNSGIAKLSKSSVLIFENDSLYAENWRKIFNAMNLFKDVQQVTTTQQFENALKNGTHHYSLLMIDVDSCGGLGSFKQLIESLISIDQHLVATSFSYKELKAILPAKPRQLAVAKPFIIESTLELIVKLMKL